MSAHNYFFSINDLFAAPWPHMSSTCRSISRGILRPARAHFSSTWRAPTPRLWRWSTNLLRCGVTWPGTICWETFMKTRRKTASRFRCVYKSPTSATLKYLLFLQKKIRLKLLFVHQPSSHIFNSPVSSLRFRSTLDQHAWWRGRSTPPSTASPQISTAQR